jgi:XTP/dITP diphosphohydrolase
MFPVPVDFFPQKKLLIASHNPGKVNEFAILVKHWDVQLVSAASLNLPEPEETGVTFTENARLKARAAAQKGLAALADDSGLCVETLDGAPGIHSARWAGPDKNFAAAMRRVEKMLLEKTKNTSGHRAEFVAALALYFPDGTLIESQGRVTGALSFPPRGDKGFGYDPIFVPQDSSLTFAEMEPAQKQANDHRARAFRVLEKRLRSCGVAKVRR